jgi:hypothetical protein
MKKGCPNLYLRVAIFQYIAVFNLFFLFLYCLDYCLQECRFGFRVLTWTISFLKTFLNKCHVLPNLLAASYHLKRKKIRLVLRNRKSKNQPLFSRIGSATTWIYTSSMLSGLQVRINPAAVIRFKFDPAIEMAEASPDRHDNQHNLSINNVSSDDDNAHDGFASLHDLFDFAEDDGRSSDSNSPTPVEDDQFSYPEQIDPAGDSDASLDSAPTKTRNKKSRDHSVGCGQTNEGHVQSKLSQNCFFQSGASLTSRR